ncbi:MAG: hypothetical protein QM831_19135 [Kofleriaceae bacterium]
MLDALETQAIDTQSRAYPQLPLEHSRVAVTDLSTGESLALVADGDFTPQAEIAAN